MSIISVNSISPFATTTTTTLPAYCSDYVSMFVACGVDIHCSNESAIQFEFGQYTGYDGLPLTYFTSQKVFFTPMTLGPNTVEYGPYKVIYTSSNGQPAPVTTPVTRSTDPTLTYPNSCSSYVAPLLSCQLPPRYCTEPLMSQMFFPSGTAAPVSDFCTPTFPVSSTARSQGATVYQAPWSRYNVVYTTPTATSNTIVQTPASSTTALPLSCSSYVSLLAACSYDLNQCLDPSYTSRFTTTSSSVLAATDYCAPVYPVRVHTISSNLVQYNAIYTTVHVLNVMFTSSGETPTPASTAKVMTTASAQAPARSTGAAVALKTSNLQTSSFIVALLALFSL